MISRAAAGLRPSRRVILLGDQHDLDFSFFLCDQMISRAVAGASRLLSGNLRPSVAFGSFGRRFVVWYHTTHHNKSLAPLAICCGVWCSLLLLAHQPPQQVVRFAHNLLSWLMCKSSSRRPAPPALDYLHTATAGGSCLR